VAVQRWQSKIIITRKSFGKQRSRGTRTRDTGFPREMWKWGNAAMAIKSKYHGLHTFGRVMRENSTQDSEFGMIRVVGASGFRIQDSQCGPRAWNNNQKPNKRWNLSHRLPWPPKDRPSSRLPASFSSYPPLRLLKRNWKQRESEWNWRREKTSGSKRVGELM